MNSDIQQHEYIDPKLRSLLLWVEEETGVEFTITSQFRRGDTGVHGQLPLRGTDLRMRSLLVGKAIINLINAHWVYDPARPQMKCAILHGEGLNLHIHTQVHLNTVLV